MEVEGVAELKGELHRTALRPIRIAQGAPVGTAPELICTFEAAPNLRAFRRTATKAKRAIRQWVEVPRCHLPGELVHDWNLSANEWGPSLWRAAPLTVSDF